MIDRGDIIFILKLCFINFQLENSDEQAAAIRRELDKRQEKINEMERVSVSFF